MGLQPGQELWNLIQGGFKAMGSNISTWCAEQDPKVDRNYARQVARGERDGKAARALRAKMARAAGIAPLDSVQRRTAADRDGVLSGQLRLMGVGA